MTELARTLAMPDGVRIAYRITRAAAPSGGTVLLLHGLASNCTRWSEFVEHTTLAQRFNLLRVDLRGHGDSFTRAAISLDRWCDDLRAILDAEALRDAVAVGHSLGAQLALRFAQRQPQRTAGLVLIDPVFVQALHGAAIWLRRRAPIFRVAIAGVSALNAIGLRRREVERLDLRQLDETARKTFLSAARSEDFVRRYSSVSADLRHFPTANYLRELLELVAPEPAPETIPVPVLAMLSRGVTFTDLAHTRALAARFPRGETQVLDAYHWPLTERPVEVRQAIEAWCTKTFGIETADERRGLLDC
jgi:pimeloyl-ACP methyl ester carboxylesterase